MKTYIITDAETKTTAVFHVAKNEKLLDRLEETTLYHARIRTIFQRLEIASCDFWLG